VDKFVIDSGIWVPKIIKIEHDLTENKKGAVFLPDSVELKYNKIQ